MKIDPTKAIEPIPVNVASLTLGRNMITEAQQKPEGYFAPAEQNWLIYPLAERSDRGSWIEIGSAGVDGICFAVRKDEDGVFAFYPIDNEFIRKAGSIASLVEGWISGEITV